MLARELKKEKANPQQHKQRRITDLQHKARSGRGRFAGIFPGSCRQLYNLLKKLIIFKL